MNKFPTYDNWFNFVTTDQDSSDSVVKALGFKMRKMPGLNANRFCAVFSTPFWLLY